MKFTTGNILTSHSEAIINTVNTYGIMGKGIALAFKRSFPDNYKTYRKAFENGELSVGKMFVHKTDLLSPKYIINFPTKKHWRNKSKMSYISSGLDDLIDVIETNNIESISIPPLGCGLGGLNWTEVKKLIVDKLGVLDKVDVTIYEPGYQSAVKKTKSVSSLTPTRAMYLSILKQYEMLGEGISTLVVQKLAYFLQLSGEDLKLNFEKANYGPYSLTLNRMLEAFSPNYLQYEGDLNNPITTLKLQSSRFEETDLYVAEKLDNNQKQRLESVINLIDGFETAFGLELLATVAWAKRNCPECSKEEIIEDIHRWNERKADLMDSHMISVCYDRLEENPMFLN